MNAPTAKPSLPNRDHADTVVALQARPERRERDFGVGYGNSSGYAAPRRYVSDSGLSRFRCA